MDRRAWWVSPWGRKESHKSDTIEQLTLFLRKKEKNLPANAGHKRCGFDPWVRKITLSRKWQPTPIFLPGESHEQRNLAGCSPWGHKE